MSKTGNIFNAYDLRYKSNTPLLKLRSYPEKVGLKPINSGLPDQLIQTGTATHPQSFSFTRIMQYIIIYFKLVFSVDYVNYKSNCTINQC